jgi:hypothetical protein
MDEQRRDTDLHQWRSGRPAITGNSTSQGQRCTHQANGGGCYQGGGIRVGRPLSFFLYVGWPWWAGMGRAQVPPRAIRRPHRPTGQKSPAGLRFPQVPEVHRTPLNFEKSRTTPEL